MTQEKDINYWKNNCEEDYITTPISVLRYISELEKLVPQQETIYKENTYKINANTYITNEEEIKKGDWFLEKAGRQHPIQWNGKEKLNFHCKKIILTTDQDLIDDGVATLPQQETFVSKGSAESQGYICPQTKKQCKDECCVSAEDCHIQAGIGVIFDCKDETTFSQTETSDFEKLVALPQQENIHTEEEFKKAVIDAYHINPQEAKWKNIGVNYYQETFKKEE